MALLILPQRYLSQPQFSAPIDYQGLGRGVKFLVHPPSGYVDLVTGREWTRNGNTQIVTTQRGRAVSFDANNSSLNITSYPELTGLGTFFAFFARVGAPDSFGHGYLSSVSPVSKYYLVSGAGKIWAGTPYGSNETISGWFGTENRSLVCVDGTDPSYVKAYIDGVDSGLTWSSSGSSSWGSGNKALEIGGDPASTTWDANADILIVGWTSEKWGETEAAAFHRNPWTLFESYQRRLWLGGAPSTDSTGTASGTSTVSGVGASTFESTGASAGTSIVSGVGSSGSEASATGAASGLATVLGTGAALSESSGNAQGTSTASGHGIGEISSTGAAAGTSTVTGVGTSATGSSGAASGTSAVNASGASVAASSGSGNGVATVTGIGASVAAVIGSASGTSTVSGVGDSVVPGSATGAASGSSTASGVGASVAASTGTASGESVVTGKSVPVVTDSEFFGGGYLYISREEHEERRKKQRIKLGIIEEAGPNLEQFEISDLAEKRRDGGPAKKKLIPARQQKKIDQEALNLELKALLQKEAEREEEIILRMLMEL